MGERISCGERAAIKADTLLTMGHRMNITGREGRAQSIATSVAKHQLWIL
jgi:hypothetical protein